MNRPFKILIAPLDWGLGHATRCIPIIRYLIEKQCEVMIAAEGAGAVLLKSNFPEITVLPIQGYRVSYSGNPNAFALKILTQVPKILKAIRTERKWLGEVQKQYQFDLVISDNRYGLKVDGLPSVIMTHQLQIKSGAGSLADRLLRFVHYRILKGFDQCWVVDHAKNGIGGELSHPSKMPSNARYIGLLSQLCFQHSLQNTKGGRILVLLSGPEPQRSLLEQKILSQITGSSPYRYTIVAGNPGGSVPGGLPSGIDYHVHLNASQLQELIVDTDLVVCRSGYSTLMDLYAMEKKALLIPTAGQSEQEYLANYLAKQGLFFFTTQSLLQMERHIAMALERPGFTHTGGRFHQEAMKQAVDEMLGKLT